jgi:hypothetical protein
LDALNQVRFCGMVSKSPFGSNDGVLCQFLLSALRPTRCSTLAVLFGTGSGFLERHIKDAPQACRCAVATKI